MKIPDLKSPFASAIRSLLEFRQSLGYGESFVHRLHQFDKHLAAADCRETVLTRKLAEDWVFAPGSIKPSTRKLRMEAVRALARFLAQEEPQTYIPGPLKGIPQDTGFRPHIYTPQEVQMILAEATKLQPAGSIRPRTYRTLFALLYCTGLRVGEAIRLVLADVDLAQGILYVRESKFHKSRAVPLHASATEALLAYRRDRDAFGFSADPEAPFFMDRAGHPLHYSAVCGTFLTLMRGIGLRAAPRTRGPRIHDFRHAFAVRRLESWYADGGNVQARLPLLSTYMGHIDIVSTQVYLTITAELLAQAVRRFQAPRLATSTLPGGAS